MDADAVAEAVAIRFAANHFQTYDANPSALGVRYGEESVLTVDGQRYRGRAEISGHFNSLPFQRCQHTITTVDGQATVHPGGVLVLVKGRLDILQLTGEPRAFEFSEIFQLKPTPEGGFYIVNDMFRVGKNAPA